jgi:hypothetical protein
MKNACRVEVTIDMVLEGTRNKMNRISVQGETRAELKRYYLQGAVLQEVGPAGGSAEVRIWLTSST